MLWFKGYRGKGRGRGRGGGSSEGVEWRGRSVQGEGSVGEGKEGGNVREMVETWMCDGGGGSSGAAERSVGDDGGDIGDGWR